MSRSN